MTENCKRELANYSFKVGADKAAREGGVSCSTIYRWRKKYCQEFIDMLNYWEYTGGCQLADLSFEVGVAEAARQGYVSRRTICNWRKKYRPELIGKPRAGA